jgi:hypothetical protein
VRSPRIEVQVKTWARAEEGNEYWANRVDIKHFNALAGAGFMVPRFLVAVIAPTTVEQYVRVDHDAMILSHAAYWLSLADSEERPVDGTGSVLVRVPKRNLLTVNTLAALVRGDVEGATS